MPDGAPPPLPSPERLQELLFDAARIGRTDMVRPLVEAGAQLEARDSKGHTALILASYSGHLETTAVLLRAGASVDAEDATRGNTALMGVAFKGHGRVARLLLEAGADVNARNGAGQTALMMAALFGHETIVSDLLAAGAEAGLIDAAGNSAVSVAREQRNDGMVALLSRDAGTQVSDPEPAVA